MHKRKANRVHRACFSCRKRKQGCDEQRPCKRCTEKGIECLEAENPRKRRGDGRGSDGEDIFSDEEVSNIHDDGCLSCSEGEESGVEAMDNESCDEQPIQRKASHPSALSRTRSLSSTAVTPMITSSPMDTPIPGTPNLCGDSDGEEILPKQRTHLALLLPFLSSHMEDNYSSESCMSSSEDEDEHELYTLSKTLKGEDFPFLHSGLNEDTDGLYRDMWFQFLGRAKEDDSLIHEFNKVKAMWADIMKCLRSLQWSKLQTYLAEIEDHLSTSSNGNEGPAVVYWSSGGRIQYANSAFGRLVGFSPEELRQTTDIRKLISVHSLFHPEDSVRMSQRQLDLMDNNQEGCYYQTRTRLITKMRREISVNASISNVRDNYGMPLLTVGHFSTCIGV